MSPRVSWRLLLPVAVLAQVACSGTAPTATSADSSPLALEVVTATTSRALKAVLEAEKDRIAAAQEASKATYDSLKAIWDASGDGRRMKNLPGTPLVICDPLQYVGQTKIMGPNGGDLDIGPHKLSIPKGALPAYVVITGEMPVSLLVSVKLSPSGLQFQIPAQLRLNYEHCVAPRGFAETERVAYINDDLQVLEWPASKESRGEVHAWIWHFSRYAVAW